MSNYLNISNLCLFFIVYYEFFGLSNHLPEYMIPSQFYRLDRLPLNHNGKVDRNALSDLPTDIGKVKEYVAPRTEIENLVADVWQTVLGIKQISITEDFISLGGQSLLAIRIIARINEAIYINLPVSAIFKDVTIERLAKRVEEYIITHLENGTGQ